MEASDRPFGARRVWSDDFEELELVVKARATMISFTGATTESDRVRNAIEALAIKLETNNVVAAAIVAQSYGLEVVPR